LEAYGIQIQFPIYLAKSIGGRNRGSNTAKRDNSFCLAATYLSEAVCG
jgi:hypothetical protein